LHQFYYLLNDWCKYSNLFCYSGIFVIVKRLHSSFILLLRVADSSSMLLKYREEHGQIVYQFGW